VSSPITADWQYRISERDFLIGNGTDYDILLNPGPAGTVGGPPVNTVRLARQVADGDILGRSVRGSRQITIPVQVLDERDPAGVRDLARDLVTGWRVERTGELTLEAREPGTPETLMYYPGKPGAVDIDTRAWLFGLLTGTLEWDCSDAYGYGTTNTLDDQSGTFTVSAGDMGDAEADTRRATLTIHGNGGTPALVSTTDDGHDITFIDALAGGESYVIDLYAQTVTRGGSNANASVSASSSWFVLRGGVTNSLTLTGAATVDLAWRPAYH